MITRVATQVGVVSCSNYKELKMSIIKVSENQMATFTGMRVEHAPSGMMLREAVVNAVEAIGNARGDIIVSSCDPNVILEELNEIAVDEFGQTVNPKKLMIANSCPNGAMSSKQLLEATDIASSINKEQGVNNNFGQGIKLTGLSANKFGFLWIVRKDGEKYAAWLRFNSKDNVYERFDFYESLLDAQNEGCPSVDIVNVTDVHIEELDDYFEGDYNAYIFLGNEPKQNTVTNPFGSKEEKPSWLVNELYKRLAFLPEGVTIKTKIHSRDKNESLKTFLPKLKFLEKEKLKEKGVQKEVVQTSEGYKIHYLFDPKFSGGSAKDNPNTTESQKAGNVCTTSSFSAYIYKNEFYDVRSGNGGSLRKVAGMMGIPYGFQNLTVFVEIPEGDWMPDSDRRHIERNDVKKTAIKITDFAEDIKAHRPQWFIEKIEEMKPIHVASNAQDILNSIAEKFGKSFSSNSREPGAVKPRLNIEKSEQPNGVGGILNPTEASGTVSVGPRKRRSSLQKLMAPKVEEIYKMEDFNTASVDEGLKHKIAQYDISSNTIWLNYMYLEDQLDFLKQEYTHGNDYDGDVVDCIQDNVYSKAIETVGTLCVNTLCKSQKKEWTKEDMNSATSMASLSNQVDIVINSDDFTASLTKEIDKVVRNAKALQPVAA